MRELDPSDMRLMGLEYWDASLPEYVNDKRDGAGGR